MRCYIILHIQMIHFINRLRFNLKISLSCLIYFLINNFSFSANYYSDPINGSMINSGLPSNPWSNLEDIMNSSVTFYSGDTIFLRNGNHGFPKINGVNSGFVVITAESGQFPMIERIYIGNTSTTSYWKLIGLTIQSENVSQYPINLITSYPSTSKIIIKNCTIQSNNNTTSYNRNDWRERTNNGIRAMGVNHEIIGNVIRNTAVGLSIESENTLIQNNEIQYFTIDGIRGLASYCIYDGNTIKDNIAVFTYSENHYDGFQSYTCCPVGTDTIKGVILRKNLIINYTDTTRQWRGPMQGLAGFDGYFSDWTIENNIVITDHWHGITLLGASNCKIINNTVVDPYIISPIDPYDSSSTNAHGPTWIKIAAHKDGTISHDNFIFNNLTADMQNDTAIGLVNNNIIIGASSNYTIHFEDYSNFNYHLINTSSAIDNGISNFAPTDDFDGSPRPIGLTYDIGAYEYSSGLSVSTINDKNNINIYPNPTNDGKFKIANNSNLNNAKITIYNIYGQKVQYTYSIADNQINIKLDKELKGLFFVIIEDSSFKKKVQLIKVN